MPRLLVCELHTAEDLLFQSISCPALTSLKLESSQVRLTSLAPVLRACPALKRLCLRRVWSMFQWQWSAFERNNITTLLIDREPAWGEDRAFPWLFEMLRVFPKLKRLRLPGEDQYSLSLESLLKLPADGALPQLEQLALPRSVRVSSDELQSLVTAFPSLNAVYLGLQSALRLEAAQSLARRVTQQPRQRTRGQAR